MNTLYTLLYTLYSVQCVQQCVLCGLHLKYQNITLKFSIVCQVLQGTINIVNNAIFVIKTQYSDILVTI